MAGDAAASPLAVYVRAMGIQSSSFVWTIDGDGTLAHRYGITDLSSTVLLGSSGQVWFVNQGPRDAGKLLGPAEPPPVSDRTEGGLLGIAVAAGIVVLCCAGPPLVLAIVGLGLGEWLTAHGLWLPGGLVLLVGAGGGLVAYRRSRSAPIETVGERGAGRGGARS